MELVSQVQAGLDESERGLSLELKIIKAVVGEISTNADQVFEAAKQKSAQYQDVERFIGNEKTAAKERADVNRAVKSIDEGKKKLKEMWMRPPDESFAKIDAAKVMLKTASMNLDQLVKSVEKKENDDKTLAIRLYFDTKKFGLMPFEQLFNFRWLLKGSLMPAIMKEMDEKIAREKVEREEREAAAKVLENQRDLRNEERREEKGEQIQDLAAEALGIAEAPEPERKGPEMLTASLRFKIKPDTYRDLRNWLSSRGVPYKTISLFKTDEDAAVFMKREVIAGEIYAAVIH
jgi:hypothetical protein